LRIIPSYKLGAFGPQEGEPTLYTWHWYDSHSGLALWVVLLVAMAAPRANRTPGVLLILVPVLLVYSAWLILAAVALPTMPDVEMLRVMTLSLAVGAGVLWLTGNALASYGWFTKLILASGIAGGTALIGMLSFSRDPSTQPIQFALLLWVLMLAMVLGSALAGRMCRRHYSPARFILLLAVWTIAPATVGLLLLFTVSFVTASDGFYHVIRVLMETAAVGLILGGCVFLISLLFVLVGLNSPLFRPRLFACLRMPLAPGPAMQEGTARDSAAPPAQTDSV
jgi:hypothetical protein